MFKWPDPPQGQIVVRLPFEIYWAVSGSVTLIFGCGIVFWYFTQRGQVSVAKQGLKMTVFN
jgi:hypothetical protein